MLLHSEKYLVLSTKEFANYTPISFFETSKHFFIIQSKNFSDLKVVFFYPIKISLT